MERVGHIETFKPSYTSEEKDELVAWFEERMERLPQSLLLDDCMSTKDLPRTVRSYIKLIRTGRKNVEFSGYVAHLFLMREALRRDNPEIG